MNGNENKYENKETNTDMQFNKDIEDINSSKKKLIMKKKILIMKKKIL